jgi:pimeloyl-ACP methyl ester carboxylesterase
MYVEKSKEKHLYLTLKQGGHFAAMEQPEVFLKDMDDFVRAVIEKLNV